VQGWICWRRSPDLRRQICGRLEAMGMTTLSSSSFIFFDRNWEYKVEVFHKHAEIQRKKTENKRK
jgi:hypothetical protein